MMQTRESKKSNTPRVPVAECRSPVLAVISSKVMQLRLFHTRQNCIMTWGNLARVKELCKRKTFNGKPDFFLFVNTLSTKGENKWTLLKTE